MNWSLRCGPSSRGHSNTGALWYEVVGSHRPMIQVFPPPIRLPRLLIEQFWHERYHDDAAFRWLRDLLPRAMQDVFATGPEGFKQAGE